MKQRMNMIGSSTRAVGRLLPLLLAAFLLQHCNTGAMSDRESVILDIQTGAMSQGGQTKTSYSDTDENGQTLGSSSQRERIDWAAGDRIRIYSPQALREESTDHWADYSVTDVTAAANAVSRAAISPVSKGLAWGSGKHYFYGMYPSPGSAPSGFAFSNGSMTGVIPASQEMTRQGTATAPQKWYPSDMRYAALLAASDAAGINPPAGGANVTVSLPFYPQYTAYEFEVFAGGYEQVQITAFTLTSADGKLSGTYTVPLGSYFSGSNHAAAAAAASVSGSGDRIGVTFSGGITVKRSEGAIRFTVLALPQTHKGLTLSFQLAGESVPRTLRLQNDSGTDWEFGPYKKYRVRGLSFPRTLGAVISDRIEWTGGIDVFATDVITWDAGRFPLSLDGVTWMD